MILFKVWFLVEVNIIVVFGFVFEIVLIKLKLLILLVNIIFKIYKLIGLLMYFIVVLLL